MTPFTRRGPWLTKWRIIFAGLLAWLWVQGSPAVAANKQLRDFTPSEVSRLAPLGRLASTQELNLAIGLPVRNQSALTEFLRELSDPTSPNYRHYLTPAQFTEQFGPTEADYAAVVAFAKAKGLKVTNTHANRMILDVQASTSTVETAFNVKMMSYQHPTEARKFYAPSAPPTVDSSLPILDINGLNNYSLPQPHYKLLKKNLQPAAKANAKAGIVTGQGYGTQTSPNVGSGPSGAYMGSDFRNAYASNVSQTGTGQTVGLLQFDGYTTSDITYYESLAGLPNVPLTNVLLDGFSGTPTGNGGEVEVSLDIEMAMSMAPSLSGIIVYEAGPSGNWHDILNRMATDNAASQLSCSWYIPSGVSDPTADQIFEEMSAQGQSFFSASGDSDAFTGLIPFPGDSPYITMVGGTMLTMNGTGISYGSEAAWNRNNGIGTGGGISTQYPIPTWQQGVSMSSNLGSTTMRNVPDVALTAEDVYVRADGEDQEVGGTSCASPLWAGFMALVNQQAKLNTGLSVGFINPAVYAIGEGANYTTDFHDTTTGNNFSTSSPTKFPAVSGYDLATGWGSPTGGAMITALAGSSQPTISTASPLAAGVVGSNYSQTFAASGGLSPYTWSITGTTPPPTGLTMSTSGVLSGIPTSSGTVTFTVQVADANSHTSSSVFSLNIYPQGTPIVATTSPLPAGNATVAYTDTLTATGGAAPLSWTLVSGSLPAGLNLSTSGVISGTPTTTGGTSFTVQVTDSNGLSSTAALSLTINAAPQPPTIATTSPLPVAKVGSAYSQTLSASGGTAPYTWSVASGALPPTLSLSTSGVISGTPAVATTGSFTVRVTGGNGLSSTASFFLTVTPQGTLVPNGSFETDNFTDWVTSDISAPFIPVQVTGNGVSPGYGLFSTAATDGSYSAVNGFDGGGPGTIRIAQDIAITSSNAVLTFDYRVGWDMKDYGGSTQARTFAVTIEPAGGGATEATFLQLTAAPGTVTLDTGSLSGMVDLSAYAGTTVRICFDCVIPQSHTGPGFFELDNVRLSSSLTPFITTASPLPSGSVGSLYSQALAASGGTTPYTWLPVAGTFPPGLTLSSSGVISGRPTATGTSTFEVRVVSANGQSATKAFGLTITGASPPTITSTSPLPAGTATVAYTDALTATGGITPYSWSLSSGSLPAGLSLSSSGVIFGTPSSSGTTTFVVQVTGGGLSSTGTLSLTINPLPSPPVITSAGSASGLTTSPFSYQITATNNPTSFGAAGLPSGLSASTSGLISGTPASTGTFNSTISASNLGGTGSATLVITVTTPAPVIVGSLTALTSFTGTNGTTSYAGLTQGNDGNFYGTTYGGGVNGDGTVFKITPTGSLTTLASFNNTNGSEPRGGVIQGSDGNFYGTTFAGGANSFGTAFKMTPSGSLTTLCTFGGSVGAEPYSGMVQGNDGNFYGTTEIGGASGYGTVYQLTPSGTLTSLISFNYTNGAYPEDSLVQGSDGNFYGTTAIGGASGDGTVFKITPTGSLTTLYSFTGTTDGFTIQAALTQGSDGNFYGTAYNGGVNSGGTVFKITPTGSLTTLAAFSATTGEHPTGGLIQGTDGNFYGTAYTNGSGYGTVYEVTPAGALTVLGTFNAANGTGPQSTLVEGSDGSFYGTTTAGGSSGDGVVFKCSPFFLTVTAGNSINYQIAATNSPNSYGASGLPGGVSVNTATGLITGAPTATGTYNATISASNGGGTANAALTITVLPGPPAITSPLAASGTATIPFSYQITASNNPTSFSASGLPPGLSVNASSGYITGSPTVGGTFNATIGATNSGGTGSATLVITIQGAPAITNGPPPPALYNTAYSFAFTTTGYPASAFTLTAGPLPTGLTLSPAGVISGTPTATGSYPGTVTANNGVGTATQSFTLVVQQPPALTNGPPPGGNLSTPYNFTYTFQGYPAPTFSVTSGALPTGLSISSTGAITGTPTASGTFTGIITASNGVSPVATQNFSIAIGLLPAPVPTPEPPTTLGSSNTVTWAGVTGAVQYDVEASTDPNFGSVIDSGWIAGTTYTFTNLSFGTTYYFRMRARTASTPDSSWSQTTETAFNADTLSNVVAETGNLFIADSNNDTIRQITTANSVTTFAGTAGLTGSLDAQGTAARFYYPTGGAFDAAGNLYISDSNNDIIRKIAPDGTTSTLAGLAGSIGSTDGKGGVARFYTPYGMAFDSSGNLYVADRNNATIRKVTPDGTVSTFAGLAGTTGSTDGAASSARFNWPAFPAVDRNNNVYVADQSNSTIRKITPTGTVTTLAGSPGQFSSADGVGSAARFNNPSSLAVDASGNVYVTDNGNSTIRKITPTGTVTTFAGVAGSTGSTDGTGSGARFNHPHGIAVDGSGNLYVSDDNNFIIRKITPSAVVTTLAGSALQSGSTDGNGSTARFSNPQGVAVNDIGGMVLAQTGGVYATSGSIVSTLIAPSPFEQWGVLSYTDNVSGSGTAVTVDVLDSNGNLLMAAVPSGTDLSTLPAIAAVSSIELRANLSTTNTANTPIFQSWSVAYFATVFSGWSSSISSTQTQPVPPVITSTAPPSGIVGTAYNFAYSATGTPAPTFSLTAGNLPSGLTLASGGALSGTPTTPGNYTGTVTATNTFSPDATQGFSITIQSTFSSWAAQYFTVQQLSDPTVSGPSAAPQNDGVSNLLKYIYDINPSHTMTAADMAALPVGSMTTISGQKYLCLTYRLNALLSGFTVSLQSSPDLHNWTTVVPDLSQQTGTDLVTGDPIMRIGVNVTTSSQEFLRLSVTSP